LEKARGQGLDLTCDVYPYTASATTLAAVLPPWAQEGGARRIVERLKQKDLRARIKDEIINGLPGWHDLLLDCPVEKVRISGLQSEDLKHLEGENLAFLAEKAGREPFEFLFDLLVKDNCAVNAVFEIMNQDLVERFLSLPFTMIGSDGLAAGSKPHPRLYGTFPKVIGRLSLQKGLFPLAEAIHKMTGMPAARLGLQKRGVLKEGYIADLVLFDPNEFIDKSTYDDPCQMPSGMELVMIDGQVVLRQNTPTGLTPGAFLRRV
jgi:dihydroorotase/N-acyl-D-amino-acid deacylase